MDAFPFNEVLSVETGSTNDKCSYCEQNMEGAQQVGRGNGLANR